MIRRVLESRKFLLIFLPILFVCLSFLYFSNLFDFSESRYHSKTYKMKNNETREIKLNKYLEYVYLHIDKDELSKLNQTYYYFTVTDNKNKEIYHDYISFKEFILKNEYRVDLRKLKLKKGTYRFRIDMDYDKSMSEIDDFQLDLKYKNKNYLFSFYFLYFVISLIMISLFVFCIHSKDKLHILFLKLALPIFLLYVIFIPALAGHDELFQWIKSYEISEGIFIPELKYGYSGAKLPKEIDLGLSAYADNSYKKVLSAYNKKDTGQLNFSTGLSIDVYSPIQFLPQALGIRVARLFTNRLLLISYSGRFFNMLLCLVLLTISIKIIPSGKKLLILLCLNPMAIEAFTTLSGDGLTVSLSILLISYILYLKHYQKQIAGKQILLLSILSILLSLCKIIYVVIPFFILLIPKKQYKNYKCFLMMLFTCLIIPIVCNGIWLSLAFDISQGASVYSIPSKNLSSLLASPLSIIKYSIYSIETHGRDLFFEFLGGDLLMSSKLKNLTLVPILMFFGIIYFIREKEKIRIDFNKKDSILVVLFTLGLIGALFLSEYVFFCRFNPREIYGFQGRHFMPFLPIVFLFLKNKWYGKNDYKNSRFILIMISIIVNFMCLCQLIVTYL